MRIYKSVHQFQEEGEKQQNRCAKLKGKKPLLLPMLLLFPKEMQVLLHCFLSQLPTNQNIRSLTEANIFQNNVLLVYFLAILV